MNQIHEPWEVVVIGAGAAGLLAATRAAECGRRTLLLEKNRKPGVKILMSGGTRCNLTHATDRRGIVEAFGSQGRFLHSALAALGPRELIDLVEAEGVATKAEPTGKIFPASDKALDVLQAFLRRLERSGCRLQLGESVTRLERQGDLYRIVTGRGDLLAENVILTTGGQSYPGCGTSGDGYQWAAALGHTIVPPCPSLVPVTVVAPWIAELKGVTIPDVTVRVMEPRENLKPRVLAERRNSFLFAHFGLSGPAILDVSREISSHAAPETLRLQCDFLPELSELALDEWLRHVAATAGNKPLVTSLAAHWPRRFAEALLQLAGQGAERKAAEMTKAQRAALVAAIKRLVIPVAGTLGFEKAEVTAGGVSLAEVDSRTLQSKLAPRLYLAGEILDLDGPIGGYNFQAAFSTGWLAGESAAASLSPLSS